jgi:hypothetical protein
MDFLSQNDAFHQGFSGFFNFGNIYLRIRKTSEPYRMFLLRNLANLLLGEIVMWMRLGIIV